MQQTLNLIAGQTQRLDLAGRRLIVLDTGAATSIALKVYVVNGNPEELNTCKRGTKIDLESGSFNRVDVTSPVNAQVQLVATDNNIDVNLTDGASVVATIAALPLAVSNDRGSPGNPVNVTAVTVSDSPATAATNGAPVAVTSAGAVLVTANAARRRVRFFNLGPDPVALGPAGATWAQRVLVVPAGQGWNETDAANLAWSGITDAGKTASVTVQGILA